MLVSTCYIYISRNYHIPCPHDIPVKSPSATVPRSWSASLVAAPQMTCASTREAATAARPNHNWPNIARGPQNDQ